MKNFDYCEDSVVNYDEMRIFVSDKGGIAVKKVAKELSEENKNMLMYDVAARLEEVMWDQKKMFPKSLKPGEVFVVPQGLLHFIINDGDEAAVIFSVLNSQNPGVAKIVDAEFESDEEMIDTLAKKIKSAAASELEEYGIQNATLTEFKHVHSQ